MTTLLSPSDPPPAGFPPFPAEDCVATWADGALTLCNTRFVERWSATPDGRLRLVSFRRADGPEWIAPQPPLPPGPDDAPLSSFAPSPASPTGPWTSAFRTRVESHDGLAEPVLVAELKFTGPDGVWRSHEFRLHPDLAGSVHRVDGTEIDATLAALSADPGSRSGEPPGSALAGRLRVKPNGQTFVTPPAATLPPFALATPHVTVREVAFVDQTDHHSNLVHERSWLMHPGERCLALRANLVCVESNAHHGDEGFAWLLVAPLPRVRAGWNPFLDFVFAFQDGALLAAACPVGYSLARVAYSGGRAGLTLALDTLQRVVHEPLSSRPPRLLSNTWGDRAGAAHLGEEFVLAEIAAAKRLGVEIVQIDDGWQKGDTVNTVQKGGVWNGFWAADPEFWTVHPRRFPRGLAPIVGAAEEAGVELGLWYAPDSTDDLKNWERDAARILELWREYRVRHYKLDAVKLHSRLAETRFHALCDRVQRESRGAIEFDFDATAEHRPTYWGRACGGPVFLENRFTEQANYQPHQTLRAVWTLSAYVAARRLRIEFLNPARNEADYRGDPLRPAAYPPEYLLAIALPGAPLAWFENSRVPADIVGRWRPLVDVWKAHREAFHAGAVFPVGDAPDGFSWTGFVAGPSADRQASGGFAYALLFRELHPSDTATFALPTVLAGARAAASVEVLSGEGAAELRSGSSLLVRLPRRQRHLLVRWPLA
mgnify:CR=1 FL=1|jgi:Alpha-galactosidase